MLKSPPVINTLMKYRVALDKSEAAAAGRLIRNYQSSWIRLDGMLAKLMLEIGDSKPTRGQFVRMTRYKSLMAQITTELAGLQTLTANEIELMGKVGVTLGSRSTVELISAVASGGPGLAGAFNVLPVEATKALLDFLVPGGPLYERLALLTPSATDAVAAALVEGIALGFNPRKVAAMVQDAFGRGLSDALRFTRTAQNWAYREANRANLLANSDVVEGWIWSAALDDRTCMSCVAMHGTVHPLDETLNDHHNGRCAPIPLVRGFDNPVDEMGVEWFSQQSEATQKQMMGEAKYEAWQSGKFDLPALSTTHMDDVYGEMRTEQTLKALLGAET